MRVTKEVNDLVWALRDMVLQHIELRPGGTYQSEFIRANRAAMEILCEYGHMEKVSADECGGRWFEARLIPKERTANAFGKNRAKGVRLFGVRIIW